LAVGNSRLGFGIKGFVFGIEGSGFRVSRFGLGVKFRVPRSGSLVSDLGFGVWGVGLASALRFEV